jgi:hypothetical protein
MASTTADLSLFDVTAVGPGTVVDYLTAQRDVSMVMVVTGTVTGGLVAMEASQDNTNWVTMYVFGPRTGRNDFHSSVKGAFRYWRTNVTSAITGGGSVTTTFMESGA